MRLRLLHSFLSPYQFRTDAYGEVLNALDLTLEVVEAVQSEWPKDLPLFVRISARLGRWRMGY
jgi:2,4-dienoyl-CoA reductase-like NADH-dependent reductase (Old Yellow Enzyme family)